MLHVSLSLFLSRLRYLIVLVWLLRWLLYHVHYDAYLLDIFFKLLFIQQIMYCHMCICWVFGCWTPIFFLLSLRNHAGCFAIYHDVDINFAFMVNMGEQLIVLVF